MWKGSWSHQNYICMLIKQKTLSSFRNKILASFGELLIVFSIEVNLLSLLYLMVPRFCLLYLIKQRCVLYELWSWWLRYLFTCYCLTQVCLTCCPSLMQCTNKDQSITVAISVQLMCLRKHLSMELLPIQTFFKGLKKVFIIPRYLKTQKFFLQCLPWWCPRESLIECNQ